MNLIRKQTGYYFSFSEGTTGKGTRVSLVVKDKPLKEALDLLFSKLSFTYIILGKIIVITDRKTNTPTPAAQRVIYGIVETENGEPLSGATISIAGTNKGAATNSNGYFTLSGIQTNSILQVSSIGYLPQQIVLSDQTEINVKLKDAASGLDEAVVIAYSNTSRRLNTGNVFKVKGREIIDQPVSNFVAALTGRVPGMLVTQKNGIPGTGYNVEIHGRSSIEARLGNSPDINNTLILVDGIPFAPNNNNLPTIASGSAIGSPGRNSFDLVNTNDIESIEVLKDADATAIYGSRGANGVILVTTKKGQAGKANIHINVNTGLGRITRFPEMMNTQQYISMRREAVTNDGNTPNSTNAPDLYKWDTTRYTDFKKLLIGGTAKIHNAHIAVSGGSNTTRYLLSASYRKETTVYPGNFADNIFYSHASLNHRSKNNRLKLAFSALATHDNNNSLVRDLATHVTQPPNAPAFYDSAGNLIWQQGGFSYNNPMAVLRQPYHILTNNMLADLNIGYRLLQNLTLKFNGGINNIKIDESLLQPRSSLNTFIAPTATGTAYFAYSKLKSWIAEPQLEYSGNIGKGKLLVLAGGTYQQLNSRITNEAAFGYPNDSSLTDVSKAKTRTITPTNANYRYVGVFGRVSYDWMNKYIINVTGRRDGSSRFGPGRQFGNFGAIGAAWVFSSEPFINKNIPVVSFGKLRASYGVTGSDQIGDYKYLDRWLATQGTYLGMTGIAPVYPANPNYSWQENRKLECGLDAGLFSNKVMMSVVYYRERTGNQIIAVPVPGITGFERIPAANYPAVVQNAGWEITLQHDWKLKNIFNFLSKIAITLPKNKLLSFPNLDNTPYQGKNLYIGKSITSLSGLINTGVDASSGLYTFKDLDNDGNHTFPNDYGIIGNQDARFYGSWLNNITVRNWELTCLVEFKKQQSQNLLYKIYLNKPPGLSRSNQPALLTGYWHKQDDNAYIQKLTASTASPAYNQINNFLSSDGVLSDASYWKIKMLSLAYSLSKKKLEQWHLKQCKIFISANNVAIITRYKGTDPETQDIFTLPPLRTITMGLQINF